jgi:hypothetical protein
MATIPLSRTEFGGRAWHHLWTPLANGDDGAPISLAGVGDVTVQFKGTFGVGGTIILEGTLDTAAQVIAGTATWFQLTDPQGNAISKTAAGIETVMENCTHVRPRVTGGDGTTALTATILSRTQS